MLSKKFRLVLSIFLGISFFLTRHAVCDEFDFGEEQNSTEEPLQTTPLNKSEESFFTYGLGFQPIRLELGISLARQTGNPMRWTEQSPFAHLIVDLPTKIGRLFTEGTFSYNNAYKLEKDPDNVIDHHMSSGILRELYYQLSLADMTFSVGQKIEVFGQMDYLPILDILSPKDNTKLFFAKPEEARIGQNLLAMDFWSEENKYSLYFIPAPRTNLNPKPGHPYNLGQKADKTEPPEENSFMFQSTFKISNHSFEFLAGNVYQYDALLEIDTTNQAVEKYYKQTVVGTSLVLNYAPYLFKIEAGRFTGRRYQITEVNPIAGIAVPKSKKVATTEFAFGFERQTNEYGLFAFESSILNPDEKQGEEIKQEQLTAFAWSDEYWNNDLSINAQWLTFDHLKNHMVRVSFDLQVTNYTRTSCNYTYMTVGSDSEAYRRLENFDRVGCDYTVAL